MKKQLLKLEDLIYDYRYVVFCSLIFSFFGIINFNKFKVSVRDVPCSEKSSGANTPQWVTSTHYLHVLKSFPKKDIPALVDAVNDWNELGVYKIVLVLDYRDLKSGYNGYNTIGQERGLFDDKDKNKVIQALTMNKFFFVFSAKTYIVGSDIVINGSTDLSGIDMRTLLRHELGHFLGIQHKEDNSELMNPFLSQYTVKSISQWDENQLKCLAGMKYNESDRGLASTSNNSK